jgi:hypothetical protein
MFINFIIFHFCIYFPILNYLILLFTLLNILFNLVLKLFADFGQLIIFVHQNIIFPLHLVKLSLVNNYLLLLIILILQLNIL